MTPQQDARPQKTVPLPPLPGTGLGMDMKKLEHYAHGLHWCKLGRSKPAQAARAIAQPTER